jgi:hypothetical protein
MTRETASPLAARAVAPTAAADAHSAILLLDAVRLVAATVAADLGGVAEIIDSGAALKFAIAAPRDDGQAHPCREIPRRGDQSICGYSIEMANATISPNLAEEKRFTDALLRESGVTSALCVPILADDQPLGALGVFSRQPRQFKLDDVWFVENVAEMIAAMATRINEERSRRERCQDDDAAESAPSVDEAPAQTAAGDALTAARGKPQGKDLRVSPRRPYSCRQKVYPIVANQLPSPESLYEVQCGDISCGGISFLLPEKPTFAEWVVALGRPPAVAYFTARTAHVRQIPWQGRMFYKVGCRLIDRVQL